VGLQQPLSTILITTSKYSFHGTGISIFQHPADENDGVERQVMIFKTDKPTTNQISELPDEYTNMKPALEKNINELLFSSFGINEQPQINKNGVSRSRECRCCTALFVIFGW
jgi:hypothetical protein